jgi:hypothetical protein
MEEITSNPFIVILLCLIRCLVPLLLLLALTYLLRRFGLIKDPPSRLNRWEDEEGQMEGQPVEVDQTKGGNAEYGLTEVVSEAPKDEDVKEGEQTHDEDK